MRKMLEVIEEIAKELGDITITEYRLAEEGFLIKLSYGFGANDLIKIAQIAEKHGLEVLCEGPLHIFVPEPNE